MAPTKQRFEKLAAELIQKLTGFEPKDENFALCTEYALSSFHYHNFLDVNSNQLQATIQGLCDKFTIHSQKEKASAFLTLTRRFLESEVFKNHAQLDVQYSLLLLLVFLANCPTTERNYQLPSTHSSHRELEQKKSDWRQILCEKEKAEPLSSDGFSDWTDSEEDDAVESQLSSRQPKTSELKLPDELQKVEIEKIDIIDRTGPELGRTWLKENVMPNYWAGACVVKEPRKEHVCNKLNRQWETYLQESGIVLSKNSSLVLTEYQIIREALWLLHGCESSFLFTKEIPRVCLSHVTNKSLDSMLSKIGRYGEIVAKLGRFVDKTCGMEVSKERCQTLEAYATALSHVLTNLKEKIFAIEKRVLAQNSIYTFTHLLDDLSSHFEELEFFDSLHVEGIEIPCTYAWQRATKLLNVLYERITIVESLGCGNNHIIDLFLNLFLTTFKPFVTMMDVWIREGTLEDRHDEFILKRHVEINEGDEDFWNGAITVREDRCRHENPLLPDQMRRQFLQAGKSMQLLSRLGKMEAAVTDDRDGTSGSLYDEFLRELRIELIDNRKKENVVEKSLEKSYDERDDARSNQMMEQLRSIGEYDPLLMMNFRRMRDASRGVKPDNSSHDVMNGLKAPFRCPLNQGIQNALSRLIYKKYEHNCRSLIGVLKRDFCLLNYISIMRKFFLMEAGDIMFNFYSEVFDLIFNGERWKEEVSLTILLQDAIAAHYPHHSSSMSVVIEEITSHLHQPIELVSAIRLNCKIPWPVNIVITNRMQRMYNQIFTFLLQVKWAKYSLDELRFQTLETSRASLIGLSSETNRRALTPRVYLLRMRMLHFVNNVHTYIMTQSLHTTGMELEQRLNCAVDLEQVVKFHSIYVDQLYHSCLLDDQMALVRQAIVWVLSLAVNFRSKWDLGVNNFTEKDISEMEGEFSKCCKLLKSLHGNTTRSGSFVEWLYNFVLQDWAGNS